MEMVISFCQLSRDVPRLTEGSTMSTFPFCAAILRGVWYQSVPSWWT
jgi:hypothetical protein